MQAHATHSLVGMIEFVYALRCVSTTWNERVADEIHVNGDAKPYTLCLLSNVVAFFRHNMVYLV